jgi:hypothetical protein
MVRETVADGLVAWDPELVAGWFCATHKAAANKIAAREIAFTRFSNLGEIERFLTVFMVEHVAENAKDRKD